VLIVCSHTDWLRQILDARQGRGASLAQVLQLTQGPVSPNSETVIAIQSGSISDLSRLWLEYFERVAPQVLDEQWWRDKQPGGPNVSLGITVTPVAQNRRLRVLGVDENMPASGILRVDDEISGCNRQLFATTQPVQEIVRGIANRPDARWVDLLVSRGEDALVVRVPVPFMDPIQMLRRAIAVGRLAQRFVYHDDVPDTTGPRGFLTIELRRSARPLFDFNQSPTSQPVSPMRPSEP
jgi:hypothetical protein